MLIIKYFYLTAKLNEIRMTKVRFLRTYLTKYSDPKICKNCPPTQLALGIDGAVFANFWITILCQVRSLKKRTLSS